MLNCTLLHSARLYSIMFMSVLHVLVAAASVLVYFRVKVVVYKRNVVTWANRCVAARGYFESSTPVRWLAHLAGLTGVKIDLGQSATALAVNNSNYPVGSRQVCRTDVFNCRTGVEPRYFVLPTCPRLTD